MKNRIKDVLIWLLKHKVVSVIAILVLAGGGYWWYASTNSNSGKVSYVTTSATKGAIVTSVSGSGQVSASDQIDLKSKVSANVVYVGVKNGQRVGAGTFLMELDASDAQKTVRDAQISLDNANLALQKLTGSSDTAIPLNKQQAQDNLSKTYEDGFNAVSNTFLDLSNIITNADSTFFKNINTNSQDINYYINYVQAYYKSKLNQANNYADSVAATTDINKANGYRDNVTVAYQKAHNAYDKNVEDYKLIYRDSNATTIEGLINQTYATIQDISDMVKKISSLVQLYQDILAAQNLPANSTASMQLSTLDTQTGKINTDISTLSNVQTTIKNDKTVLVDSDLDLQSQKLSLKQAENSLQDAKDNLADYYIYAPFAGIIASVALKNHDAVSSGTIAATLITNQSMTEIPFNEVDITKIKVGQKATLTFDAIDSLSIVGQVTDIDTLGTVIQGVVNYNVKIAFDAQNTQVKPGMSVTASVITDVKQDVLTVPNSAIKTSGGAKYVQVLINGQPQNKNVETGLSNDTDTEITGGLNDGDNVVTQTITSTVAPTTIQGNSAIRIPGLTGGGGGFGGGTRTGATGR